MFLLRKWYMDCTTADGLAVIAYHARVRWGVIHLGYASLLRSSADGSADVAATTPRPGDGPIEESDLIRWMCPRLGVEARWRRSCPPVERRLIDSEGGKLDWRCTMPRAECDVELAGIGPVRGQGYVECLELTLAPWNLPIRELRWGRWLGEHSSLVWIEWRGSRSLTLILEEGRDVTGVVADDAIELADGRRLALDRARTIREGELGATVLAGIPRLRDIVPPAILRTSEQKWLSRGVMKPAGLTGWAIHERVVFGGELTVGKWLYGLLFVVVLPLALLAWARATRDAVGLPAPAWPVAGCALASAGLAIMLEAMRLLWVRGRGLPMNAYPPTRLVTGGVYAIVPHPIYVGFCAACLGLSLAAGSRSGLWLVSPTTILGCAALVLGYEGPALRERFAGAAPRPLLRPPEGGDGPPTGRDRLAVYLMLFLPWLIAYEAWGHVPITGGLSVFLPCERAWPVLEWTAPVYSLAYPFVLAVPLLLKRRQNLRWFFISGIIALVVMMLSYIAVPVTSPPRAFDEHAVGGWLLTLEQSDGVGGAVSFPSYHVVWSILAVGAYARNGRGWAIAAWLLAAAIAGACMTTGAHAVLDVVAAVPVALAALCWERIWSLMLRSAERIANSWSCVRLGPVRVINYAAYAGLSAGLGMAVAGSLVGSPHAWGLGVVALASLVCAGLWGQLLVGSLTLRRPFGYFGALIGAALGLMWIAVMGSTGTFWSSAAALAVAAPWIVLVGRFRCLVQGCCHGRDAAGGIRYRHPHSRVCCIAHLENIPVHPTPVYSMLDNAVIGILLARMWGVGASCSMIAGVYLILAGLTRFVEESTRGEPQTQIIGGLRIYQWLAVLSAVAGATVTTCPSPAASGGIEPGWPVLRWSLAVGAAYAFAMGVDFPGSNRRFSRLV